MSLEVFGLLIRGSRIDPLSALKGALWSLNEENDGKTDAYDGANDCELCNERGPLMMPAICTDAAGALLNCSLLRYVNRIASTHLSSKL